MGKQLRRLFLIGALFCLGLWAVFAFFQKAPFGPQQRLASSVSDKPKMGARRPELGRPEFVGSKSKKDRSALKKHIENQWALKNISLLPAREALDERRQLSGSPVVVAVVDTGIHPRHPCLKGSLWTNKGEIPGNRKDDDKNGFVDDIHGWNFVDNNNDIQDTHGHGTHVSGIIAARGESPQSEGCQVIGVAAEKAQIMTLKYFDENGGDNVENTIKAVEYALANGADIINYSGGGPGENLKEKAVISKVADKGVIFVAALGNEGEKIGGKTKYYPASYELPNILFVQSQNEANEIIESSNRVKLKPGESRNVQTAPGENIISTLPPRRYMRGQSAGGGERFLAGASAQRSLPSVFVDLLSRGLAQFRITHNRYGKMTGTSQATAVVTGVVALVKSQWPDWDMEQVINQVARTGFVGRGTEKIKAVTNQGKKLDAHRALIMRDSNVTHGDQPLPNQLSDKDNPLYELNNEMEGATAP